METEKKLKFNPDDMIAAADEQFLTWMKEGRYEAFMNEKQQELLHEALELKQKILERYGELLLKKNCKLHKIIYDLSSKNLRIINFRCPSWKKN